MNWKTKIAVNEPFDQTVLKLDAAQCRQCLDELETAVKRWEHEPHYHMVAVWKAGAQQVRHRMEQIEAD